MGQYYRAVILEDGKRNVYDPMSMDNGWKLMEHSWWLNDFCAAIAEKLFQEPRRLAWVGDYAESEELLPLCINRAKVWGERAKVKKLERTNFNLDSVKWLVNKTKNVAIDLEAYKLKSIDKGWIVFPISLLTAIGNGRGGGDYHDSNPNYDAVGSWAWDELYLSNVLPESCSVDSELYFKEV